jgi:hypothetical protein
MSPRRLLPVTLSVLGLIFFLLTSSVYFFFWNYDFSATLTVMLFILSFLFSWAAVASLKFAREGGAAEIMAWGIALLDSILSIALILMFLLGSGLFGLGM